MKPTLRTYSLVISTFILASISVQAQTSESPTNPTEAQPHLYTGNYADPRGGTIHINWEENHLIATGDSLPRIEFVPVSDSSFTSEEYNLELIFRQENDQYIRLIGYEEGQMALNVQKDFFIDLTGGGEREKWIVHNRGVIYDGTKYQVDSRNNAGFLWLKNTSFKNGVIEFEAKGNNMDQQSFLGLAFHAQNIKNYDAVYFRPFNFDNPERLQNTIQYISLPGFDWFDLRERFPGKYEGAVDPAPRPDDWFHVKIVIESPVVSIFVNHSETPNLSVNKISENSDGMIGLWVSVADGTFRNLKVTGN